MNETFKEVNIYEYIKDGIVNVDGEQVLWVTSI